MQLNVRPFYFVYLVCGVGKIITVMKCVTLFSVNGYLDSNFNEAIIAKIPFFNEIAQLSQTPSCCYYKSIIGKR